MQPSFLHLLTISFPCSLIHLMHDAPSVQRCKGVKAAIHPRCIEEGAIHDAPSFMCYISNVTKQISEAVEAVGNRGVSTLGVQSSSIHRREPGVLLSHSLCELEKRCTCSTVLQRYRVHVQRANRFTFFFLIEDLIALPQGTEGVSRRYAPHSTSSIHLMHDALSSIHLWFCCNIPYTPSLHLLYT